MPLAESDILGRRIEKLFVSSTLDFTTLPFVVWQLGNSPWIASSKDVVVSQVSVKLLTGSAAASTRILFGSASATADWSVDGGGFFLGYTDSPAMIYPSTQYNQRPGPLPSGGSFWAILSGSAFNAGTTGIINLYGWVY